MKEIKHCDAFGNQKTDLCRFVCYGEEILVVKNMARSPGVGEEIEIKGTNYFVESLVINPYKIETTHYLSKARIKMKNKLLQEAWDKRLNLLAEGEKLRAEGDRLKAEGNRLMGEGEKLRAEGDRLWAEVDKIFAEMEKLWAEGDHLFAEGDIIWAEAILKEYGNIKIEWYGPTKCELENGDIYE